MPVDSRWRFVALVAWLVPLLSSYLIATPELPVDRSRLRLVATGLAVVGVVGYAVVEGVTGYRASQGST